jgi:ATP-dependent RNA helicase RhlE
LPTRELAVQVQEMLAPLGRVFGLHTAVLIGGVPIHTQIRDLSRNPRILIATPGRLIDLLENRRVRLDDISIMVLDEADRMFDMGFAPQLNRIVKLVPKQRQTLLFSATMSPAVLKLATAVMAMPVRIEVAPSGTTAKDIEQEIFIIRREAKLSLLERLLQDISGTMLVFLRTKHAARKVTHTLKLMGHKAAEIHSNRSQSQRREALSGFKSGRYRVLVATDIASRGIDVEGIEAVINFDLPANSEDYVHRIGRTGRAGKQGRAISFATPDQGREIRAIEKLIRKTLTVSQMPGIATHRASSGHASEGRRAPGDNRPYRPGRRRPFRRRRYRGSRENG